MDLTPQQRELIYLEEKAREEARSRIRSERNAKAMRFVLISGGLGVGGLILLLLIVKLIPESPDAITVAKSRFRSSAVAYINVVSAEGATADQAMINITSLDGIIPVLQSAESAESDGYSRYLRERGYVPAADLEASNNLADVHRLFQKGMDEMLMGARGEGNQHIPSGGQSFEQSIRLATSVVKGLTGQ